MLVSASLPVMTVDLSLVSIFSINPTFFIPRKMSQLNLTKLFSCFLVLSTVTVFAPAHKSFADMGETSPAATVDKKYINLSKVLIGGVNLKTPVSNITGILGTPLDTIEIPRVGTLPGFYKKLVYPGLTILVKYASDKDTNPVIDGISLEGSSYSTDRGIKVGDSLATLKTAYSNLSMDELTGDADNPYHIVMFRELGQEDYLVFEIGKTGKIVGVYLNVEDHEC
jgi:hypothetical protein